MVGSQLPWTWIASGVLVLVVSALFFVIRRASRLKREQLAVAQAQEREKVLARIEDVKSTPPLSVPPSMRANPQDTWIRHSAGRFSRRSGSRPE